MTGKPSNCASWRQSGWLKRNRAKHCKQRHWKEIRRARRDTSGYQGEPFCLRQVADSECIYVPSHAAAERFSSSHKPTWPGPPARMLKFGNQDGSPGLCQPFGKHLTSPTRCQRRMLPLREPILIEVAHLYWFNVKCNARRLRLASYVQGDGQRRVGYGWIYRFVAKAATSGQRRATLTPPAVAASAPGSALG
jgi:hypothetical protein